MPRGGYEPDRNNFAPRVGFAWTPDQAGQMVVRGGYGLYYNQGALATGEGLYFNAPYFDFNLFVPFPGAAAGDAAGSVSRELSDRSSRSRRPRISATSRRDGSSTGT